MHKLLIAAVTVGSLTLAGCAPDLKELFSKGQQVTDDAVVTAAEWHEQICRTVPAEAALIVRTRLNIEKAKDKYLYLWGKLCERKQ